MGAVFAIFAGFTFWFPVLTGLTMNSALLRISWYAPTLHGLPRFIHSLKPSFFLWEVNENCFCCDVYRNCVRRTIK